MSVRKIKISELPEAETLTGFQTVGVDASGNSARVSLGFLQEVADSIESIQTDKEVAAASAAAAAGARDAAQQYAGQAEASVKAWNVPVFDLIKTKGAMDYYYDSDSEIPVGDDDVAGHWVKDYFPCLRFLGTRPADTWSICVYMYRNKRNKGYKKILASQISECESPTIWTGGGYQTVILPWSLMRIFWELFDPTASSPQEFHASAYNGQGCAQSWIQKCRDTGDVVKYGKKVARNRVQGAFFSGSFGVRLVNDVVGIYGQMQKFRITLFKEMDKSGMLHLIFDMKIDSGAMVQTFR